MPPQSLSVEYRSACRRRDWEAAFRLIYSAYRQSNLAEKNSLRMRLLPHHLEPTTHLFVAERAGDIVSTITLIGESPLGLPMETVYPQEVAQLRRRGQRLGEVSCLASQPNLPRTICLELFRLMVQTARHRGMDGILVAIHPQHERFYRRYLSFELIGKPASYPAVCHQPAVPLLLDFAVTDRRRPANWQRFFGTSLPAELLCPIAMSPADRHYFSRRLQQCFPVGISPRATSVNGPSSKNHSIVPSLASLPAVPTPTPQPLDSKHWLHSAHRR